MKEHFNYKLDSQLIKVFDDDQRYRALIGNYVAEYGAEGKETDSIIALQNHLDSINLVVVLNILDQHGWPRSDMASAKGRNALWAVMCHADTNIQETVMPVMELAVKKGFLDGASLAYIKDKLSFEKNGVQLYGTQFQWNEKLNSYELLRLYSISTIDQERARLGLEPLREYLKENKITIYPNQYK